MQEFENNLETTDELPVGTNMKSTDMMPDFSGGDTRSLAEIIAAQNGTVTIPDEGKPEFANSLEEAAYRMEQEAILAEHLLANPTLIKPEVSTIDTVNKNQFADVERELVLDVTPVDIGTAIEAEATKPDETETAVAVAPPINLASLKIVKNKDNLYEMNKKKRLAGRPTYQVVLPQSKYSASLYGLSTLEVQSIVMGKADAYTNTNNLYSLIHEKLADTSVGKVNYSDFLKMTSSLEEDILLFGLYCATYPTITELPLKCDTCKQNFNYKTLNDEILLMEPEERDQIIKNIQEIVNLNFTSAKQVLENSDVNTVNRVYLPDSGIVVDTRIPSLYNKLEDVMKKINDELAENRMESVEISIYVDNLLVPDADFDGFIQVDKYEDIIEEIQALSPRDFKTLTNAIEEKASKLKLKFGLSNVVCTHCGHKFEEDIELDIRQILFMMHRHSMQK